MIIPYTFTPSPLFLFSDAHETKVANLLRSFALAHVNKRPPGK